MPADHGTPNAGDERAVDDFDEQAITDILVGIDEVLEAHGRERMDIIDGPTVDALRDVVKRELVVALDRGARCEELATALAFLVNLKDGPRDEAYERDKPLAWQRAREVMGWHAGAVRRNDEHETENEG